MVKTFIIDLFCGAGGTTTAVYEAGTNIEVVACVNHDENAIRSHHENYPDCVHYTEDIRTLELSPLVKLINKLRRENPGCLISIWASLECTNYSKAKGGLSRDADSRSLANHLLRYIKALDPDFIWIENVREFMDWGPLRIKEGKKSTKKYCELAFDKKKDEYVFVPVKDKKTIFYEAWKKEIKELGFDFDYRVLNSADYGGVTIRTRYFAQFAKKTELISFPEPTHSKTSKQGNLFEESKKPWRAVREVLDLEDEGQSIFNRKKPYVENTLKRIYAGLVKFVANGDESFIQKYFSGDPNAHILSLEEPCSTVTTIPHESLVKCVFLTAYYSGGGQHASADNPAPTITTKDRLSKVEAEFLVDYQYNSGAKSFNDPAPTLVTKDKFAPLNVKFFTHYYSGGGQNSDVNKPHPTLLQIPKSRLMSVNFMDNQYGNSKPQSVDKPSSTIPTNPKQNMVCVVPWIMTPNFNNIGSAIQDPCPTLMASRKHYYVMNPKFLLNKKNNESPIKSVEDSSSTGPLPTQYLLNPQYNSKGGSIENPCFTLIARMDKRPPYLINTVVGGYGIIVYHDDSPMTIKIKQFMAAYGIADIKMRMLKIIELLQIQGFPKDYKLIGTKTEQKKYIGNSVEVEVGKALFRELDTTIQEFFLMTA